MAGLVAAHTVTALEIKETGLAQTQGASHATLAQIADSVIPEDERAPGNNNSDDTHPTGVTVSDTPTLDDHDISAKIDIETEANLGGLAAKEEFILKKLRWYRDNAVQTLCDMDDQCREKVLLQKARSKDALDAALATATANAKQCRVDFVEATLTKKEIVKGDLEELLNAAIQDIKQLKVAEIFTESGIPGGDNTAVVQSEIEGVLTKFNIDSTALYVAFNGEIANDTDAFILDESDSCLDVIKTTFEELYDNDEDGAARGLSQ